jgi:hypothetical protein
MQKVMNGDWVPGLDSITSIPVNFTMHEYKPRQVSWETGNARPGIA